MSFAIRRFRRILPTGHHGGRAVALATLLTVFFTLVATSPGVCADQKPGPGPKAETLVQLPVLFSGDPWTHSFVFWQPSGESLIWDAEKRAVAARFRPAAKVAGLVADCVRQYVASPEVVLDIRLVPLAGEKKLVVQVGLDWFVLDTQNGKVVSQYRRGEIDSVQWFLRNGRTIAVFCPSDDERGIGVSEFDFGLGKEIKRDRLRLSEIWPTRISLRVRSVAVPQEWPGCLEGMHRAESEPAHTAVIWDLAAGKELRRVSLDESPFFHPSEFSPDGTMFACASDLDKDAVTVRETRTCKVIAKFDPPRKEIPMDCARFSRNGGKLLLSGGGPTAIQWSWKDDGSHQRFTLPPEADSLLKWPMYPTHGGHVGHCEQWSADESSVFMVGQDVAVYEFEAATGKLRCKHAVEMKSIPAGATLRGIDSPR